MFALRTIPIRHKLMIISLLTTVTALVLACVAFVTYEQIDFRQSMTRDLSITARMIGINSSAALSFDDPQFAEQTLQALDAQPHVVAACIYDSTGEVFATYVHNGNERHDWPEVQAASETFTGEHLALFQNIELAGESAGTIYLQSDLGQIRARWQRYGLIAGAVLATTILLASLMTARLQRIISGPISHLDSVAARVAAEKDYSLRAVKQSEDEMGRLTDSFNDMLSRIEAQNAELRTARNELERKVEKRTAELRHTHQRLLDTSRQAGMAEVATSVLHNVGNVLNSVNVTAGVLRDRIRTSKSVNLSKVTALLQEHENDLAAFLTEDDRGRKLPRYLDTLAVHVDGERKTLLNELDSLRKNIDHINDIVAMQQNYAKVSGFEETVPVVDMVEDALRMSAGSLKRHDVELIRDYRARPVVSTERHKVLQILVNVLRNAKYACDDAGASDKQITVRISEEPGSAGIEIVDNGIGIPPENLSKIFGHGFTTRKGGHGFGLHSSALAAKEIGGSLQVSSAGHLKGSTFSLTLPLAPVPSGRA